MTLSGETLGLQDYSTAVRVGGTQCEATVWKAANQINCKMPSGFVLSAQVVATVINSDAGSEFQIALPATSRFTYDKAFALSLNPTNSPTTGDIGVVLSGQNFALNDRSPKLRVGFSNSAETRWTSDTSLGGISSPSVLEAQPIVVSMEVAKSSLNTYFSYNKHSLNKVGPTNSATGGGTTITINGKGFGVADMTPHVRMGNTGCKASAWLSDTAVKCKLPSNTESGVTVVVTLLKHFTLIEEAFSYNDPFITSFHPNNVGLPGGERVTIEGFNFGASQYDPRAARFGDTACLNLEWNSDTEISCIAARGYSKDLQVSVTLAGVVHRRIGFTYNKPEITSLISSNGPASGSAEMLIQGSSFGVYELTPFARIGDQLCMKTEWVAETTMICKIPEVPKTQWQDNKWYLGGTKDVQVVLGSSQDVSHSSFTYDQACVGPCVISLACDSSTRGFGCNGKTAGDYRHSKMSLNVQYDDFSGKNEIRVIGNFSMSAGLTTIGNTTDNVTKFVREEIYNDDVIIRFGGLYTCEPIYDPLSPSTVESYLDCVMPAGVGFGHEIEVTVRNATYKALLDGCSDTMKELGNKVWPLSTEATEDNPSMPFGNCFLPTALSEEFSAAESYGLTFSYNRPIVSEIRPNFGANIKGATANITIFGQDFGAMAREIWEPECSTSNTAACRQLFQNGIALLNFSCTDIDLLVNTPSSSGAEVQAELLRKKLAFCKTANTFMVKCQKAFTQELSLCTIRDFRQPWLGFNCPETMLRCETPLLGGTQEASVVIGGLSSDESSTFSYNEPQILEVFPPELAAGQTSLLTVRGRNFGGYLAVEYGGRLISVDRLTGAQTIVRRYSEEAVPFNQSTVDWWDWSQYQTCFSAAIERDTSLGEGVFPSSQGRICDAGLVYSTQIQLSTTTNAAGQVVDQMVVQSPALQFAEGQIVLFVDIIVQVLRLRSIVEPTNATISFRAPCQDVNPQIGNLISNWYLAAAKPAWSARSSVGLVSHDKRLWVLGGATQTQSERDEVYTSQFSGANGWTRRILDLLWWDARVNLTAVTFNDVLFVMGGVTPTFGTCWNDVWVYCESQEVLDYYRSPDTPIIELSLGDAFRPFWVKVTDSAPWAPRSRAQALVFNGKLYLMGGVGCQGDWKWDLWTSKDMVNWQLVTANAPWRGRNEIWATLHGAEMVLMGSVQEQFYNTFASADGIHWEQRPDACALTQVTVQALVSYRGYLMAFTLGCHDELSLDAHALDCSSPRVTHLQNQVYYSPTGQTWTLSRKPYQVDGFERARHIQHKWSGERIGEYRFDYKVIVHLDVIYLVGGDTYKAPRSGDGELFFDEDGEVFIARQKTRDIWVSKGLVPATTMCNDRTPGGLQIADTTRKLEETYTERSCVFVWSPTKISTEPLESDT